MTSSIKPYSLTKLPEYITLEIASNLDYIDLTHFFETCKGFYAFREEKNERLERGVFSHIKIFGRKEWKEYWNGDITDAYDPDKIDRVVLLEFLKCYYGKHPFLLGLVKDHCLIPAVKPEHVTIEGKIKNHGHQLLREIVQKPLRGLGARYVCAGSQSELFAAKLDEANRVGRASLILVLDEAIGTNRPWFKDIEDPDPSVDKWKGQVQCLKQLNDKYECEEEPNALLLNTALFADWAVTGIYHLNTSHGQPATLVTKDLIRSDPDPSSFRYNGCFPPGNHLEVSFKSKNKRGDLTTGVAVIRQFGTDLHPPKPEPSSRWIHLSFVQRQYIIAAVEHIPFIGQVIGLLNQKLDKTMGPKWEVYHIRSIFFGTLVSFAIALYLPIPLPLVLAVTGIVCTYCSQEEHRILREYD